MLSSLAPFFYYIKKYKGSFAKGSMALVVTDVTDVLTPFLLGLILDQFLQTSQLKGLYGLFGVFAAVSLVNALARYMWRINFANFSHSSAHDLRMRCFQAYFKKDHTDFSKQSTGDKMSVFSKDIENFRMGIGPGLIILLDGLLYLSLIPFMMWQINPNWAIILLFIAPIVPITMALMEKQLNRLFDSQQKELSELSSQAQESIEGIRVIKSFSMERFREILYDKENTKLLKTSTKLDFIHSSFSPLFEFFIFLSCSALLFLVAFQSDLSSLQVGALFTFFQYLQRMTWPLAALGFSYMMISEAKSSFKRIEKAFVHSSKNLTNAELPEDSPAFLSLENIHFGYNSKKPLFQSLDLKIQKNQSYIVTGKTESGKSSLLKVLAKIAVPESGSFAQLKGLKTVYNPQDPFLFMDSLENNLLLNSTSKITEQDLHSISYQQEWDQLPSKGKNKIGEKGANFSGGQKQRLSLLRALKAQPSLAFLDEPISAVDETTKKHLISTLKKQTETSGLIVATSNPEHYLWADNFILIEPSLHGPRKVQVLKRSEVFLNESFLSLLPKNYEAHL